MQFNEGELRPPIDRDNEIELALSGSDLGDIDMEIADWIGLELALGRSFAFDLRQAGDPMTLKAAMQRRARQARDRRLQCVKAVVERRGTVRNFVREAMMMERRESSHGYREGTSGPVAWRSRSERGVCQGRATRRSEEGAFGADSERRAR